MCSRTAHARSNQYRTSLYAEITDKIIAELEAGRVPWVQPWGKPAAKASLAMPPEFIPRTRETETAADCETRWPFLFNGTRGYDPGVLRRVGLLDERASMKSGS
jgi:hypothetical protein